MENTLIEKFDKSRYNMLKWFTVGWTIWFGTYIVRNFIGNNRIIGVIALIGFFGLIVYAISLFKFMRLRKEINADSSLKEALNNEMYQYYKYKSFFWGFISMLSTISIFMFLAQYFAFKAIIVCEISMFVGVSSALIARLIYDRG
jgi:hypothetical protein